MIPKIIHRTIPNETTPLMDKCWNSVLKFTDGWKHLTHFDDDDYSIVKQYLPLCPNGAFRADLIRLEALYVHGGIYLDSDVEIFKPLDSFLSNKCFTIREDEAFLGNSVLGSEPGNKFIEEALNLSIHIVKNNLFSSDGSGLILQDGSDGEYVGGVFGPHVITKLSKKIGGITIFEPKTFFPYGYAKEHRDGENFSHDPKVFGVHHWAGSWLPVMPGIENINLPTSKNLNFKLYATKEDDLLQKIFINDGCTDNEFYDWAKNNVKPGWIIYDFGANIFEYTEIFARLSGPDGEVYSFEPQKELVENYKIAQRYNSYDNVSTVNIFNFGVSNKTENVILKTNLKNLGGSSMNSGFLEYFSHRILNNENFVDQEISVKRLDEVELPHKTPDLIKLDVEGAEWQAWQGFPDFIKNTKIIIAEVGKYTEQALLDQYMFGRKAYDFGGNLVANDVIDILEIIHSPQDRQYNFVFIKGEI
jgi:FkbM family methyltransferase